MYELELSTVTHDNDRLSLSVFLFNGVLHSELLYHKVASSTHLKMKTILTNFYEFYLSKENEIPNRQCCSFIEDIFVIRIANPQSTHCYS